LLVGREGPWRGSPSVVPPNGCTSSPWRWSESLRRPSRQDGTGHPVAAALLAAGNDRSEAPVASGRNNPVRAGARPPVHISPRPAVLHTHEVTGSSPVAPTTTSNQKSLGATTPSSARGDNRDGAGWSCARRASCPRRRRRTVCSARRRAVRLRRAGHPVEQPSTIALEVIELRDFDAPREGAASKDGGQHAQHRADPVDPPSVPTA